MQLKHFQFQFHYLVRYHLLVRAHVIGKRKEVNCHYIICINYNPKKTKEKIRQQKKPSALIQKSITLQLAPALHS